ncbi:MAG TPA: hypothetical protein VED01_28240 [Burkholderiales bacterium]|nr:hypothetical protein [Burkholderiales bacterium]
MERWRLLDTGLASAAHNIAISRALLEARRADEIPSTLRFLRYAPSALLACRQSAAHEFDTARCALDGVALQRRITGGAAWLADERQLGWELYLHRRDVGRADMRTIGKRIAHAAATAVSALGIDARCRSADDIEIEGRTVGVIGAAAEGDALLFQAVLYLELDAVRLARLARVPFARAGQDAATQVRARVCGLKDVLRRVESSAVRRNLAEAFESEFDVEFSDGDLTLTEHARFERARCEIETQGWIELARADASSMPLLDATHTFPGGRLRAVVKYDAGARVIRDVWFSGNVGLEPRRLVADLEAALHDTPMDVLARRVEWFFRSRPTTAKAAQPADFVAAVRLAAGQPLAASS